MTTHFIIMSSSYTMGKRIALDIINSDIAFLRQTIDKVKKECGEDVSITTHILQTVSPNFKSVIKYDLFFKDVYLVKDIDEFIKLIRQDRVLKGIDVAKYILSKMESNHLMLEKLTYYCYADYLVKTGKKLFDDKILAYSYGPVIESIYTKFKRRGKDTLSLEEIENKIYNYKPKTYLPAKSRILFADSGLEKLNSIDDTLDKYSYFDVWQLVKLTHKDGTPWQRTTQSSEITDDLIIKYHKVETI